MAQLVPTKINGIPVLIEAVTMPGSQSTGIRRDASEFADDLIERAQEIIHQLAETTAATVRKVAGAVGGADALEVQFGIKFTAQGQIIIAGASAEASINVKITYSNIEPTAQGA